MEEMEEWGASGEESLFTPKKLKARKDYQCHICRLRIEKGETYIRQNGICHISDKHFSLAQHELCPRVKKLLFDALKQLEGEAFRVADGNPEFVHLTRAVEQAKAILDRVQPNIEMWGGL